MIHKEAQAITVRGAWRGEVNDPQRRFEGKVTQSDYPAVRKGSRARVTFGHSSARSHNAAEHGTYTLQTSSHSVALMSFTCRTVGTAGHHGADETREDDWLAVPLER